MDVILASPSSSFQQILKGRTLVQCLFRELMIVNPEGIKSGFGDLL